jgi:hypothetical protein
MVVRASAWSRLEAQFGLAVERLAGLPADRSIGMSRARMAAVSAVQADSHETHERPLPHA